MGGGKYGIQHLVLGRDFVNFYVCHAGIMPNEHADTLLEWRGMRTAHMQ